MSIRRALLPSCLALLACVPAAAQTLQPTRPERPYRGMFASGVDSGGQSLTANASLSGGYDDNILADATQRNTLRTGQQGTLAQFSGGLNYSLMGERGQLTGGAGTSIRYYPSLQQDYFKTYNANVAGILRVLTKPNLTVHQSVSYQPFTLLSGLEGSGVDPGLDILIPPTLDFVPIATQYVAYDSGADLDVRLSRRTSFVTSYSYRVSDRTSDRFWRQTGSMGFRFGVSRNVSLHTMYRYNEAHYPGHVVKTHSPDIGLDFDRALSLTRRTKLTFGVGTDATVVNDETRYRATGNVAVTHEIGRSWSAQGTYQRGTFFIDTLSEPVFGDSASAEIGGLLTRRIQLQAIAGLTNGAAGFNVGRQFDSYHGMVSLSTALNRFMNVGVDYTYYKYIFDPLIDLEPGLPRNINRQSIRGHVSFWAPLMNRTRRRNASR